jgi:hypothetical protein
MDEIEVRPLETSGAIEGSEGIAAQKLDDATFEPRAYTEQIGDYRQAEAIQSNFTAVIEQVRDCPIPIPHTGSELSGGIEQVGVTPLPIPRPDDGSGGISIAIARDDSLAGQEHEIYAGPYEKAPGGDDGGENVMPINLPNVRDEVGRIAIDPVPLPRTASELTGGIEQVGTLPTPLPRTAEEAGASHVPLTPDTSRPEVAGAEERDTVRGQQPQVLDGVFQPAPAGSGSDQENITPINLPNVRNEGLASGAQGKVSVASVEGGNAKTIEEVGGNQIVDSLGLRLNMVLDGSSQIKSTVANIVKVYNNDNSDI